MARKLGSELVDLRRTVHRRPELGFAESNTAKLVVETLARLAPGASCRSVAGTGVVASLDGDGPTVLLRACLDALPIEEGGQAEYRSSVPGVSHACGHDGQVAVLVGALALLAAHRGGIQVHGLFQPAEEIDTGARAILDEGLLEELKPDVALGFHGHPSLPTGSVGVKAGPVMASITTLRCEVRGKEGHGAEPHLTSDAVTAAASLVIDWQVALSRRVDPRQQVVLSIGRLESGVTPNVVPGRAEIEGTLRSLSLHASLEDELERILHEVARGVEVWTGTSVTLSAERVVPAVVNDPIVCRSVTQAAAELLGPGAVVEATPTLGGDDFAWFLQQVPGCYFFIGERQEGREPYGWHDASYDLDEGSLVYGSAVLAYAARRVAEEEVA